MEMPPIYVMKKAIMILAAVLAVSVALNIYQSVHRKTAVTGTVIDTIPYYLPMAKDSAVVRYVTERLQIVHRDTQTVVIRSETERTDSAEVVIPITQKRYEDSTYTAWVSGYKVSLDSIRVYRRTQYIQLKMPQPRKRWGIGVGIGCGITPQGFQPYIGVSVQYSILNF